MATNGARITGGKSQLRMFITKDMLAGCDPTNAIRTILAAPLLGIWKQLRPFCWRLSPSFTYILSAHKIFKYCINQYHQIIEYNYKNVKSQGQASLLAQLHFNTWKSSGMCSAIAEIQVRAACRKVTSQVWCQMAAGDMPSEPWMLQPCFTPLGYHPPIKPKPSRPHARSISATGLFKLFAAWCLTSNNQLVDFRQRSWMNLGFLKDLVAFRQPEQHQQKVASVFIASWHQLQLKCAESRFCLADFHFHSYLTVSSAKRFFLGRAINHPFSEWSPWGHMALKALQDSLRKKHLKISQASQHVLSFLERGGL